MKSLGSIGVILLLLTVPNGIVSGGISPYNAHDDTKSYLAFDLMPAANSTLVTYAMLTFLPGNKKPMRVVFLTRDGFLGRATGAIESVANPDDQNLFTAYEIQDCNFEDDSISKSYTFNCSIIDKLWKLRYKSYPYKVSGFDSEAGWAANKYTPSAGQVNMLRQFGIHNINDFFYGPNAFKLLRAMQNPSWVSRYRSSM